MKKGLERTRQKKGRIKLEEKTSVGNREDGMKGEKGETQENYGEKG